MLTSNLSRECWLFAVTSGPGVGCKLKSTNSIIRGSAQSSDVALEGCNGSIGLVYDVEGKRTDEAAEESYENAFHMACVMSGTDTKCEPAEHDDKSIRNHYCYTNLFSCLSLIVILF